MPLSAAAKLLVIHNPVSGRPRRHLLDQVCRRLEAANCSIALRQTERPGDAERFAETAAGAAFDAVIVAGGDGTINEVVNGLARSPLPLGLIPMGTANVLAAELGLPETPAGLADVLLRRRLRRINLGVAAGRRFTMMAGVGFDAHVVADLPVGLKRRIGKGAYVWQSVVAFVRYRPVRYRLNVDGKDWTVASAVIANGHYYAGRFTCAPQATLDAPTLHVCLFHSHGRGAVLRYASALLTGRLTRRQDVTVIPAARVMIDCGAGEPVQGDGDIIATLPAEIALDPTGIEVIAP